MDVLGGFEHFWNMLFYEFMEKYDYNSIEMFFFDDTNNMIDENFDDFMKTGLFR